MPLLLLGWIAARPACADSFQDQIAQSFPGFVIMGFIEFDADIRRNLDSNPAFITGYFDQDTFEDFAALIRDQAKKRYVSGNQSHDYYEARLVVCHGTQTLRYTCATLLNGVTVPPEYRYLVKYPPGRMKCRLPRGGDIHAATEYIGWASSKSWATGTREVQFAYQPDDSYLKCRAAR